MSLQAAIMTLRIFSNLHTGDYHVYGACAVCCMLCLNCQFWLGGDLSLSLAPINLSLRFAFSRVQQTIPSPNFMGRGQQQDTGERKKKTKTGARLEYAADATSSSPCQAAGSDVCPPSIRKADSRSLRSQSYRMLGEFCFPPTIVPA